MCSKISGTNPELGQHLVILENRKARPRNQPGPSNFLSAIRCCMNDYQVKWLLYTFGGPGCYLISHDLPRYVFQLCLGFLSLWLGTQTASISLQSGNFSYKNAGSSWILHKTSPQGYPTTPKHTQSGCLFPTELCCLPPAVFNCQHQLCRPRLSTRRYHFWNASFQDIAQRDR